VWGSDFIATVPVDGKPSDIWVYKRPYLDFFLKEVAAHFEVVVFTASLATYADVVLDIVDRGSLKLSSDRVGATCETPAVTAPMMYRTCRSVRAMDQLL
jgi:TFIIF-interacting CTD phosphatase-like protein